MALHYLKEKNLHIAFDITIILKGIHALLEILGGIVIFFTSQEFILSIIHSLTQEELAQDPKDFIANYLLRSAQHISISSQHFAAFYLLSHGIIKIILVTGLLKNKQWAYPASLTIFSLFILYQVFRFSITHSIWLLVISLLDLLIIWLTWHEYTYQHSSNLDSI